jgi:hypothetical protein
MFQNERALKKMTAGDIIDYSVEVYKRNFKRVTILSLIFYVPFSFLYSVITNFFSKDFLMIGQTQDVSPEASVAFVLVTMFMGVLYVFYLLTINAVMSSAVTKVIYDDIVYQRSRKLKTVISESFKRFPGLFGYKTLMYLIMIGVAMGLMFGIGIVFAVLTMILGLFGAMTAGVGGYAGVGVFAVLMIVMYALMVFSSIALVGFFYIKFGFGVQVIAVENKGATEGISRSIALSKFNYKSSFGALFFGYILYYFIPSLATGVVQVLSFLDSQVYNSIFFVATTAINITQSIFSPFIVTLMTVIFINMKIANEGLDLEVKVDKMLEQQKNTDTGVKLNAQFEVSE